MTESPGGPDVVVIGNLTIDDVVHPDGETTMASPGGNAIHAAVSARIWGVSVGVVARVGADFPGTALGRLAEAGIDTLGLRPIDGPTVRNWVIYERDGRRHWVYRTAPGRSLEVAPRPEDLPAGWTAPQGRTPVVHVAAMPFRSARRIVEQIRADGPAVITLDTHEGWTAGRDEVVALARQVDVFVPSRDELTAVVGHDDPVRACAELLEAGVAAVVVKCGSEGAVVARPGAAVTHVAAAEVAVVDVTGAGDSFCGGLAAGLALGESLVVAAERGAATAGAAVGASGSLRLLRRAALAERLRTDRRPDAAAPTEPLSTGPTSSGPASTGPTSRSTSRPAPGDDSDVMEREITTTPAVIRDRLELAGGAASTVERLRESGVANLVLVGCGDSNFACQAATLALNRHSGLRVRWEHALDFARYGVRYQPEGTAVVVVSFSGQTGRTIEAAHQARAFGHLVIGLTGAPDSPMAKASDCILSAEIPTFGFSPGTSTYTAMLMTLLTLAGTLGSTGTGGSDTSGGDTGGTGAGGQYQRELARLPELAAETLRLSGEVSHEAARQLLGARMTVFLGAGPNEATAKFGAAKLFEGAQQVAAVTNIEEWAHEQYFITRPGDPVVLVAPSGASADRAAEILTEINYVDAAPVFVSDMAPPGPAVHLPVAAGVGEELSAVLTSIPLSQLGLHLMRLNGKRSYNFPDEDARREHYDTIHRVTIGQPA
jgi:sugar/nucleoside kinase (ribokinase family)/fructoselysine-6-P-deglycase FrlB-like protein